MPFQSLYQGDAQEQLGHVAPYLVSISKDDLFLESLLRQGWGKRWMSFLTSEASFTEIRKHFRKFLFVKNESGETVYFRSYDPAILRTFLPACDSNELQQVFGQVTHFMIEDEQSTSLVSIKLTSEVRALEIERVRIR